MNLKKYRIKIAKRLGMLTGGSYEEFLISQKTVTNERTAKWNNFLRVFTRDGTVVSEMTLTKNHKNIIVSRTIMSLFTIF